MIHADVSTDWLSGPRARKLLRLYLAWPLRFEADPEVEAEQFYAWLKESYSEMSVVRNVHGPEDIVRFLTINPEIIEAAKYLKPSVSEVENDVRRGERIRTNSPVILGVYECYSNASLIGYSQKGSVFDVTPYGLGVEIEESLPADTILNITVVPPGLPPRIFRLTGEIRWTKKVRGRYQVGVKLFEVEDASRWNLEFDSRFHSVH